MWWRFGLSLVLILLVATSSELAQISAGGASDSCGGCDAAPAWAAVGWVIVGVALVAWVGALIVVVARRVHRRRPDRDKIGGLTLEPAVTVTVTAAELDRRHGTRPATEEEVESQLDLLPRDGEG